jgi:hypothetical protein
MHHMAGTVMLHRNTLNSSNIDRREQGHRHMYVKVQSSYAEDLTWPPFGQKSKEIALTRPELAT